MGNRQHRFTEDPIARGYCQCGYAEKNPVHSHMIVIAMTREEAEILLQALSNASTDVMRYEAWKLLYPKLEDYAVARIAKES